MSTLPTLLLVDDEEGIRRVMSLLLADMGYVVLTAARGEEALARYKDHRPTLVISDIKMPGMDGIALLKELKRFDPDAEVLLLTGHGDMDLAVAGLRNGAGDFLHKPASDAALQVALDRARQRIELREALRRHTEELEELVALRTAELVRSERFAAVGESAASLAHAIKNIAGALEGTMYVLEKGLELNKREYFEQGWQMVRGDVSRLHKLALSLLDLGRPADLSTRPTRPAAPAREALETLRGRAPAGLRLELEDNAGPAPVPLAPEPIHQCLLNLALNALEALQEQGMPPAARGGGRCPPPLDSSPRQDLAGPGPGAWGMEGGGLTETARGAEKRGESEDHACGEPLLRLSVSRECLADGSGAVCYAVTDNGPGLPEAVLDPASSFHSSKSHGSGIGLFATRKIAHELGAELAFTPAPGGGTIARLRVPLPRTE